MDEDMGADEIAVLADTEHLAGAVTFLVAVMCAVASGWALLGGRWECVPLAWVAGMLLWVSATSFDLADRWSSAAASTRGGHG